MTTKEQIEQQLNMIKNYEKYLTDLEQQEIKRIEAMKTSYIKRIETSKENLARLQAKYEEQQATGYNEKREQAQKDVQQHLLSIQGLLKTAQNLAKEYEFDFTVDLGDSGEGGKFNQYGDSEWSVGDAWYSSSSNC